MSILKRPRIQNLLIILGSIIFILIVLEIGFRLVLAVVGTPAQQNRYLSIGEFERQYIRHPYLNYVTAPNFEEGLNHHNSRGYRGVDIPWAKPTEVYRIVAIGGSTTYGTGVNDWHEAYPAQLENVIQNEYLLKYVEVVNAGVPGYNSWENLINFEFRVLDLDPDMIILYQGINDIWPRCANEYVSDGTGFTHQWDITPYTEGLWRIPSVLLRFVGLRLGWFDAPHINAVVRESSYSNSDCLAPFLPSYFERNLRNLISLAQANDVAIVLIQTAWNNREENETDFTILHKEHNELIAEIGQELNIPVLDLFSSMPSGDLYYIDRVHMTQKGNQTRAEIIAEFLINNNLIQ